MMRLVEEQQRQAEAEAARNDPYKDNFIPILILSPIFARLQLYGQLCAQYGNM